MISDLGILTIISAIAFLSPLIAERIRVPAIIIELFAGFILGVSFLNLIRGSEWLTFLSSLGLIFLMFLSGLEINFDLVIRSGKTVWRFIVYTISSFLISLILTYYLRLDFLYAILLTNVSIGIVVPTLREVTSSSDEFFQFNLLTSFITDFTTMFLLSIYILSLTASGGSIQILFALAIFGIFVVAHYAGRLAIWHFPGFMARWFQDDPSEIGVRGSMAIIFFFVGLSFLLGVEAILGAFLAGALISLVFRGGEKLNTKLFGIGYGFLIPIFFIHLGSTLKLEFSRDMILFTLTLIGIAYSVKILPSFIVFRDIRNSLSFGVLQTSKLSLTIAGVEIGREVGLISEFEKLALILFTIITCIISPSLFRHLQRTFEIESPNNKV